MKPLLFLVCSACFAASVTTVTQNVVNPNGTAASGEATIKINGACESASDYVGPQTITQRFTAGAFSVNLVANSGGCVNTSYSVTWALNGGQEWQETWVVPVSVTPVTVDSVVTSSSSVGSPAWTRGTFSVSITEPLTSDSGLLQFADQYPYNIAAVTCSTDTGTAAINLDVRSSTTPNTAGTNVLASALTCVSTGTAGGAVTPVLVPGGSPVAVELLSVSGAPNVVRIFIQKAAQ